MSWSSYWDNVKKAFSDYGSYLGSWFTGNGTLKGNFDKFSGLDLLGALFGQDPDKFGLNKTSGSSATSQSSGSSKGNNNGGIPSNMVTNSAEASQDWNKLFEATLGAFKDIQAEDRAYNEKQTQEAWDRTMEASNTAHQREVNDLMAAGLNPWLSVQGSGASSPSSAVAGSSINPTQSISSATSLLSTLAQVSLLSQQNAQDWLGSIGAILKLIK